MKEIMQAGRRCTRLVHMAKSILQNYFYAMVLIPTAAPTQGSGSIDTDFLIFSIDFRAIDFRAITMALTSFIVLVSLNYFEV